jgi:hypothetical protein
VALVLTGSRSLAVNLIAVALIGEMRGRASAIENTFIAASNQSGMLAAPAGIGLWANRGEVADRAHQTYARIATRAERIS